jgi:hypothetical protein
MNISNNKVLLLNVSLKSNFYSKTNMECLLHKNRFYYDNVIFDEDICER